MKRTRDSASCVGARDRGRSVPEYLNLLHITAERVSPPIQILFAVLSHEEVLDAEIDFNKCARKGAMEVRNLQQVFIGPHRECFQAKLKLPFFKESIEVALEIIRDGIELVFHLASSG